MSTPTPHDSVEPTPFLRKPFVQEVLPLVTSLAVHLAILSIGLLTYKTIQIITTRVSIAPPIDPGAAIDPDNDAHLPLGFSDGLSALTRTTALPEVPRTIEGLADKPTAALKLTQSGGGELSNNDLDIAVGASAGAFKQGGGGVGTSLGDSTGIGETGLAQWGPALTRAYGAPFMNCKGSAAKVLFLCDSSGSMMNKFDTLRDQIRKSVDGLRPIQSFDVIFFSNDSFLALDRQLVQAVPENKRKAFEFLEGVTARSTSDPIPGLRAAFAANPQLIYMLTDGDFPNNQQVLEEIRRLQSGRASKIRINTIAFMDRGEEYEKLLETIAKESGGQFKFVADKDLAP